METKDPKYSQKEKEASNSDLERGGVLEDDQPIPYTGIVDEKEYGHVRRGLKSRHVQFIAIGGIIGTGLFVGSGAALVRAGPLSIFLAYSIVGTVIYSLMLAIGEMTTWLPIPGGLTIYAHRYLDSSFGFAMGWNYTIGAALTICAEVSAAITLIEFWTTDKPKAAWVALIIGVIFLLNIWVVEGYGEAEFIFASVKIITIIGLLILAVVLFFGGGPTHDRLGFRYWKNPGAMNEYLVPGARGRFCGFLSSFVNACFAFSGSEVICVAASETLNPRRNIPKAVRRTFWRVLIFYVFGVFAIGVLVPYNDKGLTTALKEGKSGAAASPWVAAIVNAGIEVLPHIINAVILTSAWSCGNSFMFAASRNLYALAITGNAPKIFARCSRRGIPIYAVVAVFLTSMLSFMCISTNSATVFQWFMNVTTLSSLFNWVVLFLATIRFRKACLAQGIRTEDLPFHSVFMPYAAYYGLVMVSFFILISGFDVFFDFNARTFVADYVGILIFAVPFIGHKAYTLFVTKESWGMVPPAEIDITTGKAEVDEYERLHPPEEPRNSLERIWFAIA
ncbi:amino acid permease/ SLC12A domain-containing protein [Sphaerosporella brunnea]|uniref:Amino acid permease/ SLC12A domain-containing protein n=1 Tax=Sphaerosporella brunnea TaxID=1250544 RepID=A0A5J5EU78_9PEZI|nr:amino acid permease/ SLC12A domain-containing protein [Sphaerosporella brunnea]